MKEEYTYIGPVKKFDQIIDPHWKGTTYAVSPAKARSNLIFQYKKSHGLLPSSKISLPGDVVQS